MNRRLQASQHDFVKHFEGEAEKWSRTYLFEVQVSFPIQSHLPLADFCPTVSRRCVDIEELSPAQQEFARRCEIKPSTKMPILVSDLKPQTTSVTMPYLSLLHRLGVKIDKVLACMTGKIFALVFKKMEKNEFFVRGFILILFIFFFSAFEEAYFEPSMSRLLKLKSSASNKYFRKLSKMACNSGYG